MGAPAQFVSRVYPGCPNLQAVCMSCGSERVAVPDIDGRLNKLCASCGSFVFTWIPKGGR